MESFEDQKKNFHEFDVSPGQHKVLPWERSTDPKTNFKMAMNGLLEKTHKAGNYLKPIGISYGGYEDKETFLKYDVLTPDQVKNIKNNPDESDDIIF